MGLPLEGKYLNNGTNINVDKFKAILQSCKAAPNNICNNLAKEAISLIQHLIEKGVVDDEKFKFGGAQNLYRDQHITGIIFYHLRQILLMKKIIYLTSLDTSTITVT